MNFSKLQTTTFFSALLVSTAAVLLLITGYGYAIFWAAVLATIFYPLQRWLEKKLNGRKSTAAALSVAAVLLIIVIPLSGFVSLIVQQAFQVYADFGNKATVDNISESVANAFNQPLTQQWVTQFDLQSRLQSWAGDIGKTIYQFASNSGQATLSTVIQFFIMLYTLFFFLRDGKDILKRLRYLIPLGDEHEQQLFNRFVSTSRATLKGTLVIGVVQGCIGGLGFFIAGVPGWAFWMVVMILLSVIPAVGAGVVLVPAAIIFAIMGGWWQVIVIAIAAGLAGIIDNVLRGPLVGKEAQMHPLFIFFSTLGGLVTFGISGVVIGPVITAFCLSLWEMYAEKFKGDLKKAD